MSSICTSVALSIATSKYPFARENASSIYNLVSFCPLSSLSPSDTLVSISLIISPSVTLVSISLILSPSVTLVSISLILFLSFFLICFFSFLSIALAHFYFVLSVQISL